VQLRRIGCFVEKRALSACLPVHLLLHNSKLLSSAVEEGLPITIE
jgi:hypothetical protein